VIESVFYVPDIFFALNVRNCFLLELLPVQPIDVFIQSSLPGTVGVTEVIIASEFFGDVLMLGNLRSVVCGDRMHFLFEWVSSRTISLTTIHYFLLTGTEVFYASTFDRPW